MLNQTQLTIGSNNITLNEGLYSLNDLHKASGGEPRHRPSNFMSVSTTKAIAEEIAKETSKKAFKVVYGGNNSGTFACRQLLILYAMWINPLFAAKILSSVDINELKDYSFVNNKDEKKFKTYILKNKLTNRIKIGKTTDFVTRRRKLEVYSGVGLELVALIDNDIEALLHEKFKSLKLFSEWFDASSGEIEEYAKTLV